MQYSFIFFSNGLQVKSTRDPIFILIRQSYLHTTPSPLIHVFYRNEKTKRSRCYFHTVRMSPERCGGHSYLIREVVFELVGIFCKRKTIKLVGGSRSSFAQCKYSFLFGMDVSVVVLIWILFLPFVENSSRICRDLGVNTIALYFFDQKRKISINTKLCLASENFWTPGHCLNPFNWCV